MTPKTFRRQARDLVHDHLIAFGIDDLQLELDISDSMLALFNEQGSSFRETSRQVPPANPKIVNGFMVLDSSVSAALVEPPDLAEWPEEVREVILSVCTLWGLSLPHKKSKRNDFGYWIESARDILYACNGLQAVEVLSKVRKDFEAHMTAHEGLAPFTVGDPGSLIKVVRAKAGEMRKSGERPMMDTSKGFYL